MDNYSHEDWLRIQKYEVLKQYEASRKSVGVAFLLALIGGMFGLSSLYLGQKIGAVIIVAITMSIIIPCAYFFNWKVAGFAFLIIFVHANLLDAFTVHLTVDKFNNSLKSDLEKKYNLK